MLSSISRKIFIIVHQLLKESLLSSRKKKGVCQEDGMEGEVVGWRRRRRGGARNECLERNGRGVKDEEDKETVKG